MCWTVSILRSRGSPSRIRKTLPCIHAKCTKHGKTPASLLQEILRNPLGMVFEAALVFDFALVFAVIFHRSRSPFPPRLTKCAPPDILHIPLPARISSTWSDELLSESFVVRRISILMTSLKRTRGARPSPCCFFAKRK
jgi:hypothetical protein